MGGAPADLARAPVLEDVGGLEARSGELLPVDAHDLERGCVLCRSPVFVGEACEPVAVGGVVAAEPVAIAANRAIAG